MVKIQYVVLLLWGGTLLFSPGWAEQVVTDITGFEEMVQTWVDLRGEIQSEKRVWQERKEHMVRQQNLYDKEKQKLQEAINEMQATLSNDLKEKAELTKQLETDQQIFNSLTGCIERAEKQLLSLMALVPEPLAVGFKKNIMMLSEGEDADFVQRVQNIFALYSEIERIGANVHLLKELLTVSDGGAEQVKECQVVYLGLAKAFYLSSDGKRSGIGMPQNNRWVWTADNSLVPELHDIVEILQQRKPAEFVALPICIGEDKR